MTNVVNIADARQEQQEATKADQEQRAKALLTRIGVLVAEIHQYAYDNAYGLDAKIAIKAGSLLAQHEAMIEDIEELRSRPWPRD